MTTDHQRIPYSNHGRDSAVRYYAIGPSAIRVWFKDNGSYEYDYIRPGSHHVEAMKRLAEQGQGLGSYINQLVKKNYARKF